MKKMLLSCIALAALGLAPAAAADLPLKAPPPPIQAINWTGFYAGIHAGYIWGRTTFVDDGVVTESNAPTNGFVGGFLGGYNWQIGALVLGLEGDFGWSNAEGFGISTSSPGNTYDIDWTSHVRGRIGYDSGPWLLFVAGGLALSHVSVIMPENNTTMECTGTFTGWTIGGGVDYALNRWLSGRLEYLYDDFGKKDYGMSGDFYQVRVTGHTLRAALNVKLWPN